MGVVDEVKSRLDIIDVITPYVPSLKKAGRTYKGLCPFHSEKTPSFVVFPDSQSWHCFGACGTGGDIFAFVMRQEGYAFPEALKFFADKAGVILQEKTASQVAADKEKQKLLDIVATAARYFHEQLLAETLQSKFAREYVKERGLSRATVDRFQLGYAPDEWEALKKHLLGKGYAEPDLIKVGLLVERDDGSSGYDRFRNRFMVPIRNFQGHVIGFGARALHQNQVPKYLNSPQTPLFDKSATLYGLDVAKSSIRDSGQAVIVEGYMDVLQAHEHGFTNVVAQMGTALTETQLKSLKRHAKQLILALDSDAAGNAATLRGIDVARQSLGDDVVPVPTAQGLIRYEQRLNTEIKVVVLPPGQDPDDVIRSGSNAWETFIQQALPLVEYYIQSVAAELDLETARGKSQMVQQLMPVLREIDDSVQQDVYLRQLSSLVKIDERTLRIELDRNVGVKDQPRQPVWNTPPQPQSPPSASLPGIQPRKSNHQKELCLAVMIGHPQILAFVNQTLIKHNLEVVSTQDFEQAENAALFLIIKNWADLAEPSLETLLPLVDETLEGKLASILALWHQQPEQTQEYWEKAFLDITLHTRLRRLKKRGDSLNKEAGKLDDKETRREYQMLAYQEVVSLRHVQKAIGALSITGRRRIEEKFSL